MTNAIRITIIASASVVGAAIIGGLGYITGKRAAIKQLQADPAAADKGANSRLNEVLHA